MHCNKMEWEEKYAKKTCFWHQDTAYPLFWSSIGKTLGSNSDKVVFFPMCGKTVEMKQMYDMGYTVIGK